MIAKPRTQWAIGLILSLTYTSGICSEPNRPVIELEFVANTGVLELDLKEPPSIVPRHAADFVIQWRFEPPGEPNAADLLGTPAGRSFSALQRELLKSEKQLWLSSKVYKPDMWKYDVPFGAAKYTAFAVSEEDAKKMGRAVLEFLIHEEKETARRMKKALLAKLTAMQSKLRADVAKANVQREANGKEVLEAQKKYEDAVKSSPYSLRRIDEVPHEVLKTISEMDKMLDLLNIEIVGIKSKLSAIKKYSDENEALGRGSLVMTLRELAIRQEIELVGAESRRQATIAVKKREEALYHLFEAKLDLEGEERTLDFRIGQAGKEIRDLDQDIEFLGPGELTFYIDGGKGGKKVAIQQVRVTVQAKTYPLPLYRN